jgi:hypothetical protein
LTQAKRELTELRLAAMPEKFGRYGFERWNFARGLLTDQKQCASLPKKVRHVKGIAKSLGTLECGEHCVWSLLSKANY